MNRTSFGAVAASVSARSGEVAIILTREAARHLRAHLHWMRSDATISDIADALAWVEKQTGEHSQ